MCSYTCYCVFDNYYPFTTICNACFHFFTTEQRRNKIKFGVCSTIQRVSSPNRGVTLSLCRRVFFLLWRFLKQWRRMISAVKWLERWNGSYQVNISIWKRTILLFLRFVLSSIAKQDNFQLWNMPEVFWKAREKLINKQSPQISMNIVRLLRTFRPISDRQYWPWVSYVMRLPTKMHETRFLTP